MRSPRSSRSWTRPTTPPAPIPTTRLAKPKPRAGPSAGDAMPNSMARLLLLLPTTTYRTQAFVDAATRLGVDLVCASERPSTLEERAPDNLITVDFADPDGAAETLARFARRRPIDAVIAVDDLTTVVAAAVAARLGLRSNPVAAAAAARNKHEMRRRLRAAGVPAPRFRRVPLSADPARVAREAEYPCVLKPLALSASRGVIRADDPDGFVAAFRRIAAILARDDVGLSGGLAEALRVEELILRHALGWKIDSFDRERRAAGVMMIPIPRAGRLVAVRGQDAAEDVPGVEEIAITAHLGQELVPLPEGWQYLGFIFARGDSPEEGEQALRRAHARLAFDIA